MNVGYVLLLLLLYDIPHSAPILFRSLSDVPHVFSLSSAMMMSCCTPIVVRPNLI